MTSHRQADQTREPRTRGAAAGSGEASTPAGQLAEQLGAVLGLVEAGAVEAEADEVVWLRGAVATARVLAG